MTTNIASISSNNLGTNRKRALSTPHISPHIVNQMLATSAAAAAVAATTGNATSTSTDFSNYLLSTARAADPQCMYFYNKSASGRSSFCVDESLWKTIGVESNIAGKMGEVQQQNASSEGNIYTNLALGDERYKLPLEFTNVLSPGVSITTSHYGGEDYDEDMEDNDDEFEEASDQFSPLLYPAQMQQHSSHPIPISPGNTAMRGGQANAGATTTGGGGSMSGQRSPRVSSPTHQVAYSVSPISGGYSYSPFYCGSPEGPGVTQIAPTKKISFSYDPSFGSAVNRLAIPHQQLQHGKSQSPQPRKISQPVSQFTSPVQPARKLSTVSVESAPGSISYATSPTSAANLNRSVETRSLHICSFNSHAHSTV